ncbi:MAG: amylo-alpha-1,6-glucosidase [Actinobacteria bacterium]|nr:amylo-alpha-1,6-glucosidase [Actinomycetota bacterium]
MSDLGPLSEIVCVQGESFVISGHNGNIVPGGDQGLFVRDTRFLNRLQLLIDGTPPVHLAGASVGGHRAVFHSFLPPSKDTEIDPTVSITRRRVVAGGLREQIDVHNAGTEPVSLTLGVRVGADFAYVFEVKHGHQLDAVEPRPHDDSGDVSFHRDGGEERTRVSLPGGSFDGDLLSKRLEVAPGATTTVVLEVTVADVHGEVTVPDEAGAEADAPTWGVLGTPAGGAIEPGIECSDQHFSRLVGRSVRDLDSLGLRDPDAPDDRFAAAGSPWFLTLFGRDSLWTAFMALPYDLELARGTLRVLARRQGTRVDEETEEEPGKILHEIRRGALADRGDLPSVYYGSVDATPLFVIVAHEAWKFGLSDQDLRPLIGNVEAALGWMRAHGDPDGDGFLEYVEHGERSLSNQGWKDSRDGIRFRDGRVATAPLALSEVQGYAYAAAIRGAELLDHFDRPGGDDWRAWGADLKERFRAAFWVDDADGRYPAVALDEDKRPVDGIASNMGHLLVTGILDDDETAWVAQRLTSPGMASGWGLRTLSSASGGFNPLSYHCGSVWPHDTSIAVWGLAQTGHHRAAGRLLRGLVRAAPAFNYRLPELFSGFAADSTAMPVPYPTACRPQAWAAAGALLLARAVFGFEPDVPGHRLRLRPMDPAPFERLSVTGLGLGSDSLDLHLRDGRLHVEDHGGRFDVIIESSG